MTDEQWVLLKPLLPLEQTGPGRRITIDMREAVNGMFYVCRSGCQWRALPTDFPNWNSVYYHYNKWCLNGAWRRVNEALRKQERQRQGREEEPSAGIIDSQSVKTTESGGERGYDAGKKVNGRKRSILVDTIGNLIEVVVHAADIHDRDGAMLLIAMLTQATRDRLQLLWADKAYRGYLVDWLREKFAIVLDIVSKNPNLQGFRLLPRRWVVERTFAWLSRFRRLSKDYEGALCCSEGMIYIASIQTLLNRVAKPA